MKYYFLNILAIALLLSCSNEQQVHNPEDYNQYLTSDNKNSIAKSVEELAFWNKRIKEDSLQLIDLSKSAGVQSRIFQENADIEQLKKAEKNLTRASKIAAVGKDTYLLSLAQNYITQHKFKEAKIVVDSARVAAGGDTPSVNLVAYDVAMELGNYNQAQKYLQKETDFSDYNYLIRLAKWEDYQGNLDKTIQHMENAKLIAESGKKKDLLIWVYTNLADYYGHDGRIHDAYAHYLKALEINPSNAYAKKGIAWIAYAYDNDPKEAIRIINSIEPQTMSPDLGLLKAEIFEYMGDEIKSKELTDQFIKASSDPRYGDMYNAYHIEILSSNEQTAARAVAIAKREIKNRATPETYDLLSYAYLSNGDPERALEIQSNHVIGKTYEPVAQLHLAQIYKELGIANKVVPLKNELLEASFELGPVITNTVKKL
ncbi:tetratricopeptide repeat protein [Dokdonia sp. Hel_I_53]|uniref:tetratricopeptide repeat protein n=1 Tax=Dokdonia sp. Hel_I_53 TaxID=1566287 RepID=UPI00119B3AFE|nr:tetratricopeptide repeat protein [Dokdonia sp. Hel_I_53]TVZ51972.1 tetratricopeptide repeat protein [Dokdonia sp. Hel_I_53]